MPDQLDAIPATLCGVPDARALARVLNNDPRVMPKNLKLAPVEKDRLRVIRARTDTSMSEIVGDGLLELASLGWEAWRVKYGFTDLTGVRSLKRSSGQFLKFTVDEEFALETLSETTRVPRNTLLGMIILARWLSLPEELRKAPWGK